MPFAISWASARSGAWLSTNSVRAVIFGCAGRSLTDAERRLFERVNPLGFILFSRNVQGAPVQGADPTEGQGRAGAALAGPVQDPAQVRALVDELRGLVGRPDAPVLIDQEGGRVQRLRPPCWRKAPPAAAFRPLAARDPAAAREAVRLNAALIGAELAALGIDVDCTPVLDVPVAGAHDVIGDRAYGDQPGLIAELGRAVCEGLMERGVLPVIKHIPGHGRANVDSHLSLPVVRDSAETLRATDFAPFRALADAPWAMTAHVVYQAFDAAAPATTSALVVREVIRGEIGFDGVLISDDIAMKALGGGFGERAAAVLAAGCDAALHCTGDLAEMEAVAAATSPLTEKARERLARGRARLGRPGPFDAAAAEARLARLLGMAA